MARATWNGELIAESDRYELVEGNVYFPPETVRTELLRPSETHTVCNWKGIASYYDIVVGDEVNADAAWYYPETLDAAKNVEGYVAFWRGVSVER